MNTTVTITRASTAAMVVDSAVCASPTATLESAETSGELVLTPKNAQLVRDWLQQNEGHPAPWVTSFLKNQRDWQHTVNFGVGGPIGPLHGVFTLRIGVPYKTLLKHVVVPGGWIGAQEALDLGDNDSKATPSGGGQRSPGSTDATSPKIIVVALFATYLDGHKDEPLVIAENVGNIPFDFQASFDNDPSPDTSYTGFDGPMVYAPSYDVPRDYDRIPNADGLLNNIETHTSPVTHGGGTIQLPIASDLAKMFVDGGHVAAGVFTDKTSISPVPVAVLQIGIVFQSVRTFPA